MPRIKFSVAGVHPLLYHVRDFYIQTMLFALVPWEDNPDFALIGAEIPKDTQVPLDQLAKQQAAIKDIPVILLSSDTVYGESRDKTQSHFPGDPLRYGYVVTPRTNQAIYSYVAEHLYRENASKLLTLRTFSVYGPDIKFGVVHNFVQAAKKQEPLPVYAPGYQIRSFLHQDDFYPTIQNLTNVFINTNLLDNMCLNVGSSERVTIKRLADSIWQLTHGSTVDVKYQHVSKYSPIVNVPNITQTVEASGVRPGISLRKGLWRLVGKHVTELDQ